MATTTTQTQTTTQTTTQAVNIGSPSVVVKICPFGSGASDGKKTTQAVKVGLFGSASGDCKDITEKTMEQPAWLKSVQIWSTDDEKTGFINGITFTMVDDKSIKCTLGPWGSVADKTMLIDLEKTGGYITELSGYTDSEKITSLTVVTYENKKKEIHGPMGRPNPEKGDTKFSIPLEKGAIVAFFGRSDSNWLKAIGAYVAASAEPPPGEPACGPSLRIQPGVSLDKKSSTSP